MAPDTPRQRTFRPRTLITHWTLYLNTSGTAHNHQDGSDPGTEQVKQDPRSPHTIIKPQGPAGHATDSHSGSPPLVTAAELRPGRLGRSWPISSPDAASGGHNGRAAAGAAQTHAPVLPLDNYTARCARLSAPSARPPRAVADMCSCLQNSCGYPEVPSTTPSHRTSTPSKRLPPAASTPPRPPNVPRAHRRVDRSGPARAKTSRIGPSSPRGRPGPTF